MTPLPSMIMLVDRKQLPQALEVAWLAAKDPQTQGVQPGRAVGLPWSRESGNPVLVFPIEGLNSPDRVRVLAADWFESQIEVRLEVSRFEGLLGANQVRAALVQVDLGSLPDGEFRVKRLKEEKVYTDLAHPELAARDGYEALEFRVRINA